MLQKLLSIFRFPDHHNGELQFHCALGNQKELEMVCGLFLRREFRPYLEGLEPVTNTTAGNGPPLLGYVNEPASVMFAVLFSNVTSSSLYGYGFFGSCGRFTSVSFSIFLGRAAESFRPV